MKRIDFEVTHIVAVKSGIYAVRLDTVNKENLEFKAGQYLEILMPDGSRRPLSIASPPNNSYVELFIGPIDPMKGSALFSHLQSTTIVRTAFAQGDCFLDMDRIKQNNNLLFLAGGTGISQTLSIVKQLVAEGRQNTIDIIWGVKNPKLFFLEEYFRELNKKHNINVQFVVEEVDESSEEWTGPTGNIIDMVLNAYSNLADTLIVSSGPFALSHAVLDMGKSIGVTSENLRSDAFSFR